MYLAGGGGSEGRNREDREGVGEGLFYLTRSLENCNILAAHNITVVLKRF